MRYILVVSPFYKCGNWGTEGLSNLLKVTLIVSDCGGLYFLKMATPSHNIPPIPHALITMCIDTLRLRGKVHGPSFWICVEL